MTVQLSRRTVILALVAFLALTMVATTSLVLTLARTAEANHRFNDIATGTFFHEPTAWLADNDIADGFPNGSFQPNSTVSRGQASYWLANYNNAIELVKAHEVPGNVGSWSMDAECPVGKRAVAGGGATSSGLMAMRLSRPDGTRNWVVSWQHVNPPTAVNLTFADVWALCIPDTVP